MLLYSFGCNIFAAGAVYGCTPTAGFSDIDAVLVTFKEVQMQKVPGVLP